MSIKSYFMAKFYDASMRGMEDACLADWRAHLLKQAEGNVLEIGSGTGGNLRYFPDTLSDLVLTEPDPHMRVQLSQNARNIYRGSYRVEPYGADRIDWPDESFDTVVSTLVLCSVDSPSATLAEIRRLLRPGGAFLFIEHVVATGDSKLIRWQKFWNGFWIFMCGNCHLIRDTEQAILDAGLEFESIDRIRSTGGPAIVSPSIRGVARKPAV
jgi:SAM-dependent methyltransferase